MGSIGWLILSRGVGVERGLTAKIAFVEQRDGGHLDDAGYAGAGGGVSVGPRMGDGHAAYTIPMLMHMATPIFSRLCMSYRSSSRQGSRASAKSQNAEHAVHVSVAYPQKESTTQGRLPPTNRLKLTVTEAGQHSPGSIGLYVLAGGSHDTQKNSALM